MTDHERANPYAPPAADLLPLAEAPAPGVLVDATRKARYWAAMLDSGIAMVGLLPLIWFFGGAEMLKGKDPTFGQMATWQIGGTLFWLLVHGRSVQRSAQTLGKRVLGIQIVSADDLRPASLRRILLLRHLPIAAGGLIPLVGSFVGLVDCLFIFGSERRCLHDRIARTRVIVKAFA